MADPLLSVIMGVRDQRDHDALETAVSAVLNQTLSDFEFLICDDGSEPAEHAFLTALARRDARIILFTHAHNTGLASALYDCVRRSRGQYIARMDADDACLPDRFARQVDFLNAHPEYAWCGTCLWLFDGGTVWGVRDYPAAPSAQDYLRFSPFAHPSVVFRGDVLRENNYCVSARTLRCEDYELFMRLHGKGLRGCNLPARLYCYRENAASFRRRTWKSRVSEMLIRVQGFRRMGILLPRGCFCALRPLLAGLVPDRLIRRWKKGESDRVQQGELPREMGTLLQSPLRQPGAVRRAEDLSE